MGEQGRTQTVLATPSPTPAVSCATLPREARGLSAQDMIIHALQAYLAVSDDARFRIILASGQANESAVAVFKNPRKDHQANMSRK